MKKQIDLKITASETEKGLKDLRLVGVGREYFEKRLAEMSKQEISEKSSLQTNGSKPKK